MEIVCSKDALLCIQMYIDISIQKCNPFLINPLGADCILVLICVQVHVNTRKRTNLFSPKSFIFQKTMHVIFLNILRDFERSNLSGLRNTAKLVCFLYLTQLSMEFVMLYTASKVKHH